MYFPKELMRLSDEFASSREILHAMGDENRQHMILMMMHSGAEGGLRVGDIVTQTHLSRAAVSRHLKILKDVGMVNMREEGTKHYYYLDVNTTAFKQLRIMLAHAQQFVDKLPDRSGEDE